MKTLVLLTAATCFAHRLDEYLQATQLSVEKDRVHAQIFLTPGVAVFPVVFAGIDTDADHVLSTAEQRAYAERVLSDLSLSVDGDPLRLRLVSAKFPAPEEMQQGLGEIAIDFQADLPVNGGNRTLTFENHHQQRIAAYLVNCLVSRDPDIRLGTQHRNDSQSSYSLDYVQTGAGSTRNLAILAAMILAFFARVAWLWRTRLLASKL